MTGIAITPEEVVKARGATFLTDLDMIISPNGGHLVPVAMYQGVHVCWGCGEPFDPNDRELRLVEMRPKDSYIPVGMHFKCCGAGRKAAVSNPLETIRGLQLRRMMAKAAKPFVEAAKSVEKKIIDVVGG